MLIIQTLLFIFLSSVTIGILLLFTLVVRSYRKRLLLSETKGLSCNAPDSIGISALCSGVYEMSQIENLLNVEYERYEIVIVLDSELYAMAFTSLLSRYKMIKVSYGLSREIPVLGVRALYRSRSRSFRRVVIIDKRYTTIEDDFGVATGVATYDYVFCMAKNTMLLPNAIDRMVIEIGESERGSLDLVRTQIAESLYLFRRDFVIDEGGFGNISVRKIKNGRVKNLYEPLMYVPHKSYSTYRDAWILPILLTVGVAAAAWSSLWMLTAVLLTLVVVSCVVHCAVPIVLYDTKLVVNTFHTMKYYIRKIWC